MNLKGDKFAKVGAKDAKKLCSGSRMNVCVYIGVVVCLFLIVIGWYSMFYDKEMICGDGTAYGECSERQPYFCEEGLLVEKSSVCGCSNLTDAGETFINYVPDDSCASEYKTFPKEVSFNYVLRGEKKKLSFVAYWGLAEYLSELPQNVYNSGGELSRADFKLKKINEPYQREFLLPLVTEIQNVADSEEDQVRIAVSIVQSIPYQTSNKTETFGSQVLNYSRYPYEVLYDGKGICGEKSELLAVLLREMGYGVAFFYHQPENHESVGIKCPEQYSLGGTGYCFVETTGPSIISDSGVEYTKIGKLTSEPEVILITDGKSLGEDLYEYDDAEELNNLREKGVNMFSSGTFKELKQKYGLVEVYRAG